MVPFDLRVNLTSRCDPRRGVAGGIRSNGPISIEIWHQQCHDRKMQNIIYHDIVDAVSMSILVRLTSFRRHIQGKDLTVAHGLPGGQTGEYRRRTDR